MTDTYSIYYSVPRGGVTVNFELNAYDSDHGLTINYLGDQGFGLAPIRRITTRGPLQNGDSDIDYRLDPRILQLPLLVQNASSSPKFNSYSIRQALLSIFRPQEKGATLTVSTSNGTTTIERRINVQVLGGLTFDVDPQDYHVRTIVQLRADDPTWYNPSAVVSTYLDSNIGGSQTFSVAGNYPTFPVIRFNGPITNPTISSSTTGQSIALTATITAGNWIELDLSYGKKTVYDNLGANRISTVSATSNLATWSLVPDNNILVVTGTGTSASSDVTLTYYTRFTGI